MACRCGLQILNWECALIIAMGLESRRAFFSDRPLYYSFRGPTIERLLCCRLILLRVREHPLPNHLTLKDTIGMSIPYRTTYTKSEGTQASNCNIGLETLMRRTHSIITYTRPRLPVPRTSTPPIYGAPAATPASALIAKAPETSSSARKKLEPIPASVFAISPSGNGWRRKKELGEIVLAR
ncbi:uncharacterized protein BDR25DRAFT_394166 [Lindgomyces ingoldianus]|uniref:Uncharacterized protein n=1 Tax=Lindgomyces ingoldianus TaxID=673940 RepID=A0ACB6QU25_9PLEO|nr:uncharacterized protein BDR25DRAFT_394166 [Lindgomyces ingoldianus]KAF2469797.1 hypothetical protein BDR25DRAFT_394166 [Lindgomyces ingoldianus]